MHMVQVWVLAPPLTPPHPDPPKLLRRPVPCAPRTTWKLCGDTYPAPPQSPGGSSHLSIVSDVPSSVDQHSPASDPVITPTATPTGTNMFFRKFFRKMDGGGGNSRRQASVSARDASSPSRMPVQDLHACPAVSL
jgi:hypothetical protein